MTHPNIFVRPFAIPLTFIYFVLIIAFSIVSRDLLFYASVFACMYVCVSRVCLVFVEVRAHETAVMDGCESLCRYWELSLGPLKKPQCS